MAKRQKHRQPIGFITISDIHIGHQPIEQTQKEFFDEEHGFIAKIYQVAEFCKENDYVFGGVHITGDYFDHQLSLNSPHAKFAFDLMHAILHITCRLLDSKVTIIQGTRGHDHAQINVFEPFLTEFEDQFMIINTVQEMELYGYRVLCIPEEYMTNQTEYYQEFFAKKYDLILGHGFFKFNCFNKNEVERPAPEMPIFDQEEIVNIARLTIFGHDHLHQTYKDKIYYNGAYSQLCHGNESAKGCLFTIMNDDDYHVQLMENELALVYRTIQLDKLVKKDLNYETAVKAIKATAKTVDFLKIKITKELVAENPVMIELLRDAFASFAKKGIVIDAPAFRIQDGKPILLNDAEVTEESLHEDSVEETRSEHAYLIDTTINMDEKIHQFINIKHVGKGDIITNITIDDIRDAISSVK